ncbi:MAG: Asp-tRNA(Asn)/Glu-tRNA(Gln) amidotransferase subunit GatC [Candidatus Omnitrophica bacterium]|jgi:aspartyl-tRNA(Asn)/glutamyl-tRNA(Gln) amidotransferase subunit C|nr:Asp-tRNA(Asn)/Glu-tRNA(Gln) amidotransferase subunit GatC [Candidatus Omnitrophota bacterium]
MAKIDVKRTAQLARIQLTDEESAKLEAQFVDILGYIQKLEAVDTAGAEPAYHPFEMKNAFRSDEVRPTLGVERLLEIAPRADRGMIEVPPIIERKD